MSAVCPHCNSWRWHPNDRFCGWCGGLLIRADVVVKPSKLYVGRRVPEQVQIVITNAGGKLGGTRFLLRSASGDAAEHGLFALGDDDLMRFGEQKQHTVDPVALGLDSGEPRVWELVHEIEPGQRFVVGMLAGGLQPPSISVEPRELLLHPSAAEPMVLVLTLGSGGPVDLSGLVLRSRGGRGKDLPLPVLLPERSLPLTLEAGQSLRFRVEVGPALHKVLQALPLGLDFEVDCSFDGFDGNLGELELRLRIPTPARPDLDVTERQLTGVAGRTLSLDVPLVNHGGEPCLALAAEVSLSKAGLSLPVHKFEPVRNGIEVPAGGRIQRRLAVPLSDAEGNPLPDGLYGCRLIQRFGDAPSTVVETELQIDVRPLRPFSGVVAIDFGTTATSASYYKLDHSFANALLDGAEGHIPTAIAYFTDANGQIDYEIGHEAVALLAAPPAEQKRIRFYDNIKLRLNDPTPALLPDYSNRTWVQVAEDYLRRLKERIESSPAIAAQVDQACITQPARFDPRAARKLVAAYRGAGMEPRAYPAGEGLLYALSEAWPSAVMALPVADPRIRDWQDSAIGPPPFGDNPFGTYYLLSYDVGGGSTDLSLLAIDVAKGNAIRVTELASDGTHHFCGNAISAKIYAHCGPSFEEWLARRGFEPKQFPVRLPWQPIRPGDEIGQENGRRIAEALVYPLQRAGNDSYANLISDLRGPAVWLDEGWRGLQERMDDRRRDMERDALGARSVQLLDRLGNTSPPIPIGGEDDPRDPPARLDLAGFIADYVQSFSGPMFRMVERMLRTLQDRGRDASVYCLLSGRGGWFPLIPVMVLAHAKRLEESQHLRSVDVQVVSRSMTKSFVAAGACHIDRFLMGDTQVSFTPRPQERFGVLKGRDADNRPLFLPLSVGYPEPEDGWLIEPYPLEPGQQFSRLEFFLAPAAGGFVREHAEPMGWVEPRTELTPAQAAAVRLAVRARDDQSCDVLLLVPPASATKELLAEPSVDTWEHQFDGILHLVASG